MRFEISAKDLSRELLARAKGAKTALFVGLRSGALRGRAHMVRVADDMGKVDQGQFKNAFVVRKMPMDTGYMLENTAPYAGIIEKGARPHEVNAEGIEAITGWAMRKFGLDPKAAKGVAFAVAANLRKRGQKPTYMFRDNLDTLRDLAVAEVEAELVKYANGPAGRNKGGE